MDYARAKASADRLLAGAAQGTVTLTRTVAGTPDALEPWAPVPPTETEYALKAAVSGVAEEFVDGATIVATDLQVICAVPEIAPLAGDRMTIDGRACAVLRVMPIPAAGTVCAYRLIVRG